MAVRRLAGLTAAALLALPGAAAAAPATPDPGFGTAGVVQTDFTGRDSRAAGMLLDSQGRPVVVAKTGAMEVGLMRLTPAGTAGFATTTSLGPAGDSLLTDVAEQPGGGYVAGGWVQPAPGDRRFALVRYSDAGAFDAGFGVVLDSPGTGDDEIRALAIQPVDGRIVAAGRSGERIGVARYAAGGTPEPGFQGTHDFIGVTGERADGVVVEPGGRILLAGTGIVAGETERRFLLAALTPAGAIDGSFGTGGLVTLDVGDGDAAVRSLERQPDGKLLVAGTTDGDGAGGGVVARFLPNGTPDLGFSTDGVARLGVPGAIAEDVAVQADGKVVAVGAVDAGTSASDSFVARFRPGGVRDPGFGSDGVARRSLGPAGPDGLTGVGVAADGGIVAGGLASGPPPVARPDQARGRRLERPRARDDRRGARRPRDVHDHGDQPGRRHRAGRQRRDRAARRRRGDRDRHRGRRLHGHGVRARHARARGDAPRDAARARQGSGPAGGKRAGHGRDVRREPGQQLGQRDRPRDRQPRRPPRPHQAAARPAPARAPHPPRAPRREAGRPDERGGERRRTDAGHDPRPDRDVREDAHRDPAPQGREDRPASADAGRQQGRQAQAHAPPERQRQGARPRQGGQQAHPDASKTLRR